MNKQLLNTLYGKLVQIKFERKYKRDIRKLVQGNRHNCALIAGGRATGKTYSLFKYCEETGTTILCRTEVDKKYKQQYAHKLGFNVKLISLHELDPRYRNLSKIDKVCIDELDMFVEELLNIKLDVATTNASVIKKYIK